MSTAVFPEDKKGQQDAALESGLDSDNDSSDHKINALVAEGKRYDHKAGRALDRILTD
jgi:hypothetical protein